MSLIFEITDTPRFQENILVWLDVTANQMAYLEYPNKKLFINSTEAKNSRYLYVVSKQINS